MCIGLLGCSDDDPPDQAASTTTTTSDDPASTSSTTDPSSGEGAAVLEAYSRSWQLYDDFVNGEISDEPADYFDGELLVDLAQRIDEYADGGYELRGEAELHPSDVVVDGTLARLTDCLIDGTYAVRAATDEVVVPASTRPQLVDVRLVKDAGQWKVSSAAYGAEGSCVP